MCGNCPCTPITVLGFAPTGRLGNMICRNGGLIRGYWMLDTRYCPPGLSRSDGDMEALPTPRSRHGWILDTGGWILPARPQPFGRGYGGFTDIGPPPLGIRLMGQQVALLSTVNRQLSPLPSRQLSSVNFHPQKRAPRKNTRSVNDCLPYKIFIIR